MERLNIEQLRLVRPSFELKGSFTSVMGEYFIPTIEKTGFYKESGWNRGAEKDEDLRELLATKILDKIGFEHADIILATDGKGKHGCISVNILDQNEEFIETDMIIIEPGREPSANDFILIDLEQVSSIPGITQEDLRIRKEYVIKYLLLSAFLSNTDVKTDNMMIIKNNTTGSFRNPEYYDMGLAFVENEERNFFSALSSFQVMEELYKLYPEQTLPLGRIIEENVNEDFIKSLLQEETFSGFAPDTRKLIADQLIRRINFISELNRQKQNNFIFGVTGIHDAFKGIPASVRDNASKFMKEMRKNLERDRDE